MSEAKICPREPTQDMAYNMTRALNKYYRPCANDLQIANAVWEAGYHAAPAVAQPHTIEVASSGEILANIAAAQAQPSNALASLRAAACGQSCEKCGQWVCAMPRPEHKVLSHYCDECGRWIWQADQSAATPSPRTGGPSQEDTGGSAADPQASADLVARLNSRAEYLYDGARPGDAACATIAAELSEAAAALQAATARLASQATIIANSVAKTRLIEAEAELQAAQARITDISWERDSAEADRDAAQARIAELTEERKDWARTFMLDGRTPWEWENMCRRAEARASAAVAALRELLRVHTGPKLNDEGRSYRAVQAAQSWEATDERAVELREKLSGA